MHRIVRLITLPLAIAALLVAAGAAAAADGRIYYSLLPARPPVAPVHGPARTLPTGGSIFAAAADGSGAKSLLAGAQFPGRIRVQGDYVYWIAGGVNAVARMRTDGTGVNLHFIDMPADSNPSPAIAVTATHIYYAYQRSGASSFDIGRADLDGGGNDASILTTSNVVTGMATDDSHLLYGHANVIGVATPTSAIGRSRLDGSAADESWVAVAGQLGDIVADGSHVYWTSTTTRGASATYSVGRVALDGSGRKPALVTGTGRGAGIAVSATSIYWVVNGFSGPGGSIARAALDGSAKKLDLITIPATSSRPFGVAVDSAAGPAVSLRAITTAGGIGTFRARVSGAGVLQLRGTRGGGAVACTASAAVAAAGAVEIHCRPNAAMREVLQAGSVRVRVTITFRATGGGTATTTAVVRFAKINPSPVTG